jgi:hypothetical protein
MKKSGMMLLLAGTLVATLSASAAAEFVSGCAPGYVFGLTSQAPVSDAKNVGDFSDQNGDGFICSKLMLDRHGNVKHFVWMDNVSTRNLEEV